MTTGLGIIAAVFRQVQACGNPSFADRVWINIAIKLLATMTQSSVRPNFARLDVRSEIAGIHIATLAIKPAQEG